MKTLAELSVMNSGEFKDWFNQLFERQNQFIFQSWYEDLVSAYHTQNPETPWEGKPSNWKDYQAECEKLLKRPQFLVPRQLTKLPGAYLREFEEKYKIFSSQGLSKQERIQALVVLERHMMNISLSDINKDGGWPQKDDDGNDLDDDVLYNCVKVYLQEMFFANIPNEELEIYEFFICLERERAGIPDSLSPSLYGITTKREFYYKLADPQFRELILSISSSEDAFICSGLLDSLSAYARAIEDKRFSIDTFFIFMKDIEKNDFVKFCQNFANYYEVGITREITKLPVENIRFKDLYSLMYSLAKQLMNKEIDKNELGRMLDLDKVPQEYRSYMLMSLLNFDLRLHSDRPTQKSIQSTLDRLQRESPRPYLKALKDEISQAKTNEMKVEIYNNKNQEFTKLLSILHELIASKKNELFPKSKVIDNFVTLLAELKEQNIDLTERHKKLCKWITKHELKALLKTDASFQWLQQLVNAIFAALGRKHPIFTLQKIRQDLSMFMPEVKPSQLKIQVTRSKP